MWNLRAPGPLGLAVFLIVWIGSPAHAQTRSLQATPNFTPTHFASSQSASPSADPVAQPPTSVIDPPAGLPEAPGSHMAGQQATDPASAGSILGTVVDANGAEVANALVTLENEDTRIQRTLMTDSAGFFKFDTVEPGRFHLTISSSGFAKWVADGLTIQNGQSYDIPAVELHIASATSEVEVTATSHDIAEDEMHFAEKQRVLGIFPNFYASYVWHAAPLSSGQKFRLALRTSADPISIAIPAVDCRHRAVAEWLRRIRPGRNGLCQAFRRLLGRHPYQHHAQRCCLSDDLPPGPPLLLQGNGKRRLARHVRHFNRRHLPGRQRPLAAQLLQPALGTSPLQASPIRTILRAIATDRV